jgi:hypothetical protein
LTSFCKIQGFVSTLISKFLGFQSRNLISRWDLNPDLLFPEADVITFAQLN